MAFEEEAPSPKTYAFACTLSIDLYLNVPSAHSVSYADHRIRLLLRNEKQQRLGYDEYKEKYKNNMELAFGKDEDGENKAYRKELDKERERKLAQGLNQKDLRKKLKKSRKKKRDKSKKKKRSKKDRKKKQRKVSTHRVFIDPNSNNIQKSRSRRRYDSDSSYSEYSGDESYSSTSHSV